MTKENWIAIATIISVFIAATFAPLLNTWLSHRLTLAREKPATNQPKDKTGKSNHFHRVIQIITFLNGIIAPTILLLVEFNLPTPITRFEVFVIAANFALLVYSILFLMFIGEHQTFTRILTNAFTVSKTEDSNQPDG